MLDGAGNEAGGEEEEQTVEEEKVILERLSWMRCRMNKSATYLRLVAGGTLRRSVGWIHLTRVGRRFTFYYDLLYFVK